MIGIFDSGLGGLSVLAAISRALPQADLAYLADTAYVPYGEKDDAFIRERTLKIGRYFATHGCSLIVVACNTATAAAVTALRDALPEIPVIGVEPGIKPAAAASKSGRIAVLATVSTARSERLHGLIRRYAGNVRVDVLPCPEWATRVEQRRIDSADFRESAQQLLAPTLAAGTDQVVLGCTHYSFLRPVLEPIVAGHAVLVDVADAVARQCVRLAGTAANGGGTLSLLATARPEALQAALTTFGLDALTKQLAGPAQRVSV